MRAGRREQRLLNAKRAFQKAVALRGERTVTGKLRSCDRGPDVIKSIPGRKRPIKRNAEPNDLRRFRHSFFAFKNDTHVRDAPVFSIHRRSDIAKDLCGKLAVLLLGPNVAASVISHDKPRKRALIRDPTWIKTNQSTSHLKCIISELNAMHGILIVQVM